MNIYNDSKEAIKNRMYRHAMEYWGVKRIENLDPLVKILLEAFTSELFKLSHEIEESHHRVLEKISNMLTPDILSNVQPAHGVMHTSPSYGEPKCKINQDSGFYINLPLNKGHAIEEFCFYPIIERELYSGDVKRIISNGNIYSLDETMNKELVFHAPHSLLGKHNHTIWIGLSLSDLIHKLDDLHFFFELPHRENKDILYSLLSYAKWSLNGESIASKHGFTQPVDKEDINSLFSVNNVEKELNNNTLSLYRNQFVRLTSSITIQPEMATPLPLEIIEHYPVEMYQNYSNLYWFKVEFPASFTPSVLEELKVCINAVIIQNKRLNHELANINELTTLIPLPTSEKEYFYSIQSVTDILDRTYTELPFNDSNGQRNMTYIIRRGGSERLKSRDVKEYLYRVLDLLRDRGAIIAILEKDTFTVEIQEMSRLLESMERIIDNIQTSIGAISYLLVDTPEDASKLFISYYTTVCEKANNINAGQSFSPLPSNIAHFDSKQTYLLTSTRGGRSIPVSTNRYDVFKYILTTRDRIFTKSDIHNFCKKELGNMLTDIQISHGVMPSEKPNSGLVRTINIQLDIALDEGQKADLILSDLKVKLIDRSPSHYNYRIFTQKC